MTSGRTVVWLAVVAAAAAGIRTAAASSLEVRIDPPRIGIEDMTRMVVRIHEPDGPMGVPEIGELDGLEMVSGPSTGSEIQVLNGEVSRSVTYTWVLRPTDVGTATVGAVRVQVGDRTLASDPVPVQVEPGSLAQRRRPHPFDPFGDRIGRQTAAEARLELRHLIESGPVALGQPVTAAVALDTTVGGIENFDWIDAPSYPGWWTQRVEMKGPISPSRVEVDGVVYNRFVIARYVLVPLRTGTLEVPPVRARIAIRGRGLFSVPQVVEHTSSAARVAVEPRPDPPAGFAGAVGRLEYSAALEPERIELGESTVLTITLEGNGNLPLVEAPPWVPTCDPCQAYPPEDESSFQVDADGIRGSRSWRVTVVPRASGTVQFEPVDLAVFDPRMGAYRTRTLGPLELIVEPPPATPTPTPSAQEPTGRTISDPSGVQDRAAVAPSGGPPAWIVGLIAAVGGAAFGGIAVWLVIRRRRAVLPPRRPGESSTERARELQLVLEQWWLEVRNGPKAELLRPEMERLRREIEGVRFAPGRADHTETVEDLEARLRRLLRRR